MIKARRYAIGCVKGNAEACATDDASEKERYGMARSRKDVAQCGDEHSYPDKFHR